MQVLDMFFFMKPYIHTKHMHLHYTCVYIKHTVKRNTFSYDLL